MESRPKIRDFCRDLKTFFLTKFFSNFFPDLARSKGFSIFQQKKSRKNDFCSWLFSNLDQKRSLPTLMPPGLLKFSFFVLTPDLDSRGLPHHSHFLNFENPQIRSKVSQNPKMSILWCKSSHIQVIFISHLLAKKKRGTSHLHLLSISDALHKCTSKTFNKVWFLENNK